MNGRVLMMAGGVGLLIFTIALWYTQFHAFYRDLPQEPFVIAGTEYPVSAWRGTDASSSPLKRRVCLSVAPADSEAIATRLGDGVAADPLVAPDWFECFDARGISRDVDAGEARIYNLGQAPFDGIDDMMAIYPDGRVYLWRDLQAQYRNQ